MKSVLAHIAEVLLAILASRPLPQGWRTTLAGVGAWLYVAYVLTLAAGGQATAKDIVEAVFAALVGSGFVAAEDARW